MSAHALSCQEYRVYGDRVVLEGQELLQEEEGLQQIVESQLLGKWEVLETELQVRDVVVVDDNDDGGTRVQERCSSRVSTDSLLLLFRFVVLRSRSRALMFLPSAHSSLWLPTQNTSFHQQDHLTQPYKQILLKQHPS